MGVIKGALFVAVTVLFFISLLVMNSLFVVTSSLDYENLRQELLPVAKQALNEQINITSLIENEKYPLMQKFCANSSEELEYVFSEDNYTFTVSCSVISKGPAEIVNSTVDNLFQEYYYKKYDCGFFDCIGKDPIPFFLVSEQSKNYWQNKFYLSVAALLILLVLMLFLIEKKTNLPLVVGSLMIVSALPFMKLESLFRWLLNALSVSPINPNNFFKFFTLIFVQSYKMFLIMLLIGTAVLAFGIIAKFFAIGFKINEFFSRFSLKRETSSQMQKKTLHREAEKIQLLKLGQSKEKKFDKQDKNKQKSKDGTPRKSSSK